MDDERKSTIMNNNWKKFARDNLVGKTIREVRRLDDKHLKYLMWDDHRALQIIFTDGSWITPTIDEENNAPGCLVTTFKGLASTLI